MFTKIHTGAVAGIEAVAVEVEVDLTSVSSGIYMVGLPDNAVKEAIERVRSAIINSEFMMPYTKTIINLAPADLRKEGAAYDLPIALGILAAGGQLPEGFFDRSFVLGELSLNGAISGVSGVLPLVAWAAENGFERVILPSANSLEAAVVDGIEVIGVSTLRDVVDWARGEMEITPAEAESEREEVSESGYVDDFADVKGQGVVKRAFEIAAAGGHNIIMIGAPGSGKTMLSKRMPSIMPPMTREEALETTKVYSVAGKLGVQRGLITQRPFRAPHHITSQVAIVGGGNNPKPGEVSLAHNGVLFLDELPEFGRSVLEVLRQPLEERSITISRARYSVSYPANFTLVASMNPCPCGYYNHPTKECTCGPAAVHRYMSKISGPLLDRIDLHVEVIPVSIDEISNERKEEPSSEIRKRVIAAREIQRRRFEGIELVDQNMGRVHVTTNAMMTSRMLREFCPLKSEVSQLLERAMNRLMLSARAYDRIIKVARTIADLAGSETIEISHIAEAIGYRSLDRDSWGR